MAVLNPEHLLDQAERLFLPPAAGPPRQVDVRRAISAAYYAVFHHVLTLAADEFVGVTKRGSKRYSLVYRSVGHRPLRELCIDAQKVTLPAKLRRYLPSSSFGPNIQAFAAALVDLQEKRHAADYDPFIRVRRLTQRLPLRQREAPSHGSIGRQSPAAVIS